MAAHFFGSGRSDPELGVRNMRSVWERFPHERVQERLKGVFVRLTSPLFRVSRGTSGDLYEKYSEQAKRSRNSTSKVVSRELEDALRAMEDNVVEMALDIYEDEAPEKQIKSSDLLWAIYNFGLVPFIETEVLIDICHRLDRAQPSLGLNLFRPDGHRFFTYKSEGLRKQFPVVTRIVDELKSQWYDKIRQRSEKIHAQSMAVTTGPGSDALESIGKASGTQAQMVQELSPKPHPKQSSPSQPLPETITSIQAGNQKANRDPEGKNTSDLARSVEQPSSATAKQEKSTTNSSSTVAPRTLKWEGIEIRFLSDDRVQIHISKKVGEAPRPGKTLNYAEFGFENNKTGNPNAAWIALRRIAELNGTVRSHVEARYEWPKFEKRVQEIRRVLRKHFDISSDPIPYVEGNGYRTRFKISCAPSFHR